ncbi:hypothetical protein M2140_000132 [Clostridiales Family XIII bacterium PM5-7]
MIKYAIPGMWELRDLNFKYLNLMRTHPEFFYEDIEVEVVYGNPQFCIWDGGRIFQKYEFATLEKINHTVGVYNEAFNLPVRYIFTNCKLEPVHYQDRFGNLLMEVAHSGKNDVVVADDDFCDFLSSKYPNYRYISSTTKCIEDEELAKKELNKDRYGLVCLDYNLNRKMDFLKSLNDKEKAKTELLINAICPPGCQHRKEHYYLNSMCSLSYGKKYTMEHCSIKTNITDPQARKHYMSYETIKNVYAPMGFEHFKIEGRTLSLLETILSYCYFMVKPEYHDQVVILSLLE